MEPIGVKCCKIVRPCPAQHKRPDPIGLSASIEKNRSSAIEQLCVSAHDPSRLCFASLAPPYSLGFDSGGAGRLRCWPGSVLGSCPSIQMPCRKALRECPLDTAGDFDMTGGRSHYHPCRCSSITGLFPSSCSEAPNTSCATGRSLRQGPEPSSVRPLRATAWRA